MNPLAAELNRTIEQEAPAVMRMLSALGRELYFPKGILTQTAEANQKAHRYNATIGEAREAKRSMGLDSILRHFSDLGADEVLPYAPSAGRADIRKAWREEIKQKNPSLGDIPISLPVVTSGITHGLSTVADMFVDEGDLLLLPDKLWGNYLLIFAVKRGAQDRPLSAARPGRGLRRRRLPPGHRRKRGPEQADRALQLPEQPDRLFHHRGRGRRHPGHPGRDGRRRMRRRRRLRRRLLRPLLRRRGHEGVALHPVGRRAPAHAGHQAGRGLQRGLRLGAAAGLHDLRHRGGARRLRSAREEDRRLHPRYHLQLPERVAGVVDEGDERPRVQRAEGREVRDP